MRNPKCDNVDTDSGYARIVLPWDYRILRVVDPVIVLLIGICTASVAIANDDDIATDAQPCMEEAKNIANAKRHDELMLLVKEREQQAAREWEWIKASICNEPLQRCTAEIEQWVERWQQSTVTLRSAVSDVSTSCGTIENVRVDQLTATVQPPEISRAMYVLKRSWSEANESVGRTVRLSTWGHSMGLRLAVGGGSLNAFGFPAAALGIEYRVGSRDKQFQGIMAISADLPGVVAFDLLGEVLLADVVALGVGPTFSSGAVGLVLRGGAEIETFNENINHYVYARLQYRSGSFFDEPGSAYMIGLDWSMQFRLAHRRKWRLGEWKL